MSDATAQSEPTMEEILASIRRIINEDEEEPKAEEGVCRRAAISSEVSRLVSMKTCWSVFLQLW